MAYILLQAIRLVRRSLLTGQTRLLPPKRTRCSAPILYLVKQPLWRHCEQRFCFVQHLQLWSVVSAAREAIQSYKLGCELYVLRFEARDLVVLAKAVIFGLPFLSNSTGQCPSWEQSSSSASLEISRISWNKEVHYNVHKSAPLIPILNQIKPV